MTPQQYLQTMSPIQKKKKPKQLNPTKKRRVSVTCWLAASGGGRREQRITISRRAHRPNRVRGTIAQVRVGHANMNTKGHTALVAITRGQTTIPIIIGNDKSRRLHGIAKADHLMTMPWVLHPRVYLSRIGCHVTAVGTKLSSFDQAVLTKALVMTRVHHTKRIVLIATQGLLRSISSCDAAALPLVGVAKHVLFALGNIYHVVKRKLHFFRLGPGGHKVSRVSPDTIGQVTCVADG